MNNIEKDTTGENQKDGKDIEKAERKRERAEEKTEKEEIITLTITIRSRI